MLDGTLIAVLALAALVLGAFYAVVWWWTERSPMWLKVLVRGGLPLVFLALLAAMLPTLNASKEATLPNVQHRYEYRVEKPVKPDIAAPKRTKKNVAVPGGTSGGIALDVPERAAREQEAELRQREDAARAREDVAAATADDAAREGDAIEESGAEPGEPPPPAIARSRSLDKPDESSDWDVVPVFFGTDRARADDAQKLDYGSQRGRRLEMGRALVTVPKIHQVPLVERPWAIRIPYFDVTIYEEAEDPKKHFTMQELKALTPEAFLDLVKARLATSERFKDQAFIFVHGFNSTFENSIYRTAQIAYDLEFDGAPFLYSWPSGGGFSSYTYDRESSGQSEPYMKDFMKLVIEKTGAKAVSVIAHSMGNQPVLQVLRDLKRAAPDDVVISQVILAAPDVDRDNFKNIAKDIIGLAKGVTLYVSSSDQALQASRRFHGGVPRAGDVPASGPVIVDGIDTVDVTAASTDSLGINHSGYAENNALLKDIAKVIETGAKPNERRPPEFERVPLGEQVYWRYPVTTP